MLSEYLKASSKKDHDSIESKVDLIKLVASREHFIKLLQGMYGYYYNIELALHQFENEFQRLGINLNQRLKCNLLIEDLKHFNLNDQEISSILLCDKIQEAMGVLYVLEGSTMGGQIIYKKLLQENVISANSTGANFFRPYGQDTMPMWMEFKKSLNHLSDHNEDAILVKVRETFNTMEDWLVKVVT